MESPPETLTGYKDLFQRQWGMGNVCPSTEEVLPAPSLEK